ncbi:hypothetical protein AVEN_217594-1 [Araneus ventricosus]|uniref:Tc1-like transposase DDE domain-containing protein n=1 Tax=Araneus ventricosus TaxID=182803 RepID=A0A4Y2FHG2_ARAVE|nr:hypothetical protein AVEN_217594-1 [Araneus ventricosus]
MLDLIGRRSGDLLCSHMRAVSILDSVMAVCWLEAGQDVLQKDNTCPHTTVVTQRVLQSVDMLPWPASSPDLSPIDHVWEKIGRYIQRHPQLARSVADLTDKVQQEWNSISQTT